MSRFQVQILSITIVLLFGMHLRAQDERAKVAQSYEQSGDYRSAARLWQSLYTENPSAEANFSGLVRCYKSLNNYQALLEVAQDKMKRKKSVRTAIVLGQALVKTNRQDEARSVWSDILGSQDATTTVYRDLALAQIEVQQIDIAIETLKSARSRFDDDGLFAEDLAQIYAAQADYKHGLQEVLTAFQRNNNLQQAEGRLSAFMQGDSAQRYIRSAMAKAASDNDNSSSFLRLYEWFLREGKQYEEAFKVVQQIDKLQNAQGREILNFAEQARYDAMNELASKAYALLLDRHRQGEVGQLAAFGYAACMEARFRDGAQLSEPEVQKVIELYQDIIKTWPRSSTAADAQLRIARCRLNYLHDPTSAIKDYKLLSEQYIMFPQAATAQLELGLCYVQQDKLSDAELSYQLVLSTNSVQRNPRVSQNAIFSLGELHFFRFEFDSALAMYGRIEQTPESEFANDAIERMTTIQLNKKDSSLLCAFARAGLRSAQLRYDEALKGYDELSVQRLNSDLAEASLMKAVELCAQRKDAEGVHRRVASLAQLNAESIYADKAMFFDAEMSALEGKTQQALQGYQDLLAKFPRSLYIQDARERVRKLRGGM